MCHKQLFLIIVDNLLIHLSALALKILERLAEGRVFPIFERLYQLLHFFIWHISCVTHWCDENGLGPLIYSAFYQLLETARENHGLNIGHRVWDTTSFWNFCVIQGWLCHTKLYEGKHLKFFAHLVRQRNIQVFTLLIHTPISMGEQLKCSKVLTTRLHSFGFQKLSEHEDLLIFKGSLYDVWQDLSRGWCFC